MRYSLIPTYKNWNRWPYTSKSSLDRVFDSFFDVDQEIKESKLIPAVDVEENENEYLLKMDIPGFKKENLNIEVRENLITLSGERKNERVEKNKTYHLEERSYGNFKRVFELPSPVDEEKVEAKYEDGVLNLKLTKATQQSPKKIAIKN